MIFAREKVVEVSVSSYLNKRAVESPDLERRGRREPADTSVHLSLQSPEHCGNHLFEDSPESLSGLLQTIKTTEPSLEGNCDHSG